jgi:hypothetical protein
MEDNHNILLKGIKSHRGSIKILQTENNLYVVELKKYFGKFCYSKKIWEYKTFDDAEDEFLELRRNFRNRIFPNLLS